MNLTIDVAVNQWTLREQMAYREKVGVNPAYAFKQIADAFAGSEGGVVPDAALNIPPEYLLGMAWVTMRRGRKDVTFDDIVDLAGNGDELFEAFGAAVNELAEEEAEERPTDATETSAPETD